MKKNLLLTISICMILSLAACGTFKELVDNPKLIKENQDEMEEKVKELFGQDAVLSDVNVAKSSQNDGLAPYKPFTILSGTANVGEENILVFYSTTTGELYYQASYFLKKDVIEKYELSAEDVEDVGFAIYDNYDGLSNLTDKNNVLLAGSDNSIEFIIADDLTSKDTNPNLLSRNNALKIVIFCRNMPRNTELEKISAKLYSENENKTIQIAFIKSYGENILDKFDIEKSVSSLFACLEIMPEYLKEEDAKKRIVEKLSNEYGIVVSNIDSILFFSNRNDMNKYDMYYVENLNNRE